MTHPMPLNMAGTLVTRAVGPAKQRKQPSYFQERKRSDNLGFADKEHPDSQNSPKRVMTAFALICADFFFNWWT